MYIDSSLSIFTHDINKIIIKFILNLYYSFLLHFVFFLKFSTVFKYFFQINLRYMNILKIIHSNINKISIIIHEMNEK